MSNLYQFYGVNIDTPMSDEANETWETSRSKALHDKTGKAVYIQYLEGNELNAEYAWKIVDAYYSDENSIMSYFHAYSVDGEYIPNAVFGVSFDSFEGGISTSKFEYEPKGGSKYYVPISGFPTQDTGGYKV